MNTPASRAVRDQLPSLRCSVLPSLCHSVALSFRPTVPSSPKEPNVEFEMGEPQSVPRFDDLVALLKRLEFVERMGKGNHHIFYRDGVEEIINLQPLRDGKAKPYQVKQVRKIILRYTLHGDE